MVVNPSLHPTILSALPNRRQREFSRKFWWTTFDVATNSNNVRAFGQKPGAKNATVLRLYSQF
jgi:hypothetical protein